MWIVRFALRFPHTFYGLATLILFLGITKDRGRAFGLEGFGDNAGAFLGPLLAVFLLYVLHVGIRAIFYMAIIPGLLAFFMVLLVKEQHAVVTAKLRIDVSLLQFPKGYWHYLLVTALFGLGNSTNSFLILRTQDIGASLEMTILIYAAFNLVAALISYPRVSFRQMGAEETYCSPRSSSSWSPISALP